MTTATWNGEVFLDWRGAEARAKVTFAAIRDIERMTGKPMAEVATSILGNSARHTDIAAILCAAFRAADQRSPDTGKTVDLDEVGELLLRPETAGQFFAVARALVVHAFSGGQEGEEFMGKLREAPGTIVRRLGVKTSLPDTGRQP